MKGIVFGLQPCMYTIFTLALPYIVPDSVPYRVTIFVSLIFLGVCSLLTGPVYPEQNLVSMLVGLGAGGIL